MYRQLSSTGLGQALAMAIALTGCYNLMGAGLIEAKARLAPLLIGRAWEQSMQQGGAAIKPWPWADTWPVARLQVPAVNIDQYILAGDTGNALAFGPGHSLASAPLGSAGQAVVGGHRDTHFAFLRELPPNAELLVELASGEQRVYRVTGSWVVNAERESLTAGIAAESLLLVTCYPFDTLLPGGPLRYVVSARPVDTAQRLAGLPRSTQRGYEL